MYTPCLLLKWCVHCVSLKKADSLYPQLSDSVLMTTRVFPLLLVVSPQEALECACLAFCLKSIPLPVPTGTIIIKLTL